MVAEGAKRHCENCQLATMRISSPHRRLSPDRMRLNGTILSEAKIWWRLNCREFFALRWSLKSIYHSILLSLVFLGPVSRAIEPKAQVVSNDLYRLHFFHTHTRERLNIVYRDGEGYNQDSLARLDSYLRDHRTGEIHEFDPRLFDLLHELTAMLGNPDLEIDVVCGYRTPWSNEFLRTRGRGVARHSLHMQAMAIDIRVPGIPTAQLRDVALALHRGGVGYYPASDFVHVDVGRVRRW